MKTKRAGNAVEWICGVVSLPAYVTGEGEPYRPKAVFWISDGFILGMEVVGRSITPARVVESFRATTRAPMVGRAHVPDRLRVDSPEVATELGRVLAGKVEVVCAPTPEVDVVLGSMREQLDAAEPEDEEITYLGGGVTPEAMASFFRAAARLYRAAPWNAVPDDGCLIGVTIEEFDLHSAVLSVIGQMKESFGFVLFGSYADYEAYVDAAEDIEEGGGARLPRHLAVNFDRGAEMDSHRRKEISTHGWEVAGPHAYPWIVIIDEDIVVRPPTPDEVKRVTAIANAVAALVESEPHLERAWQETPVIRSFAVDSGAGSVVTLAAPHDAADRRRPAASARGAKSSSKPRKKRR